MCGIAGFITSKKENPERNINNMLKTLRHRGPDDSGYKIYNMTGDKELALGHVRLSILDTSKNGHQPMSDSAGNVSIVYNGEVYNAFDYREELIKDGVQFKSRSDTEIIVYLYLKYGIQGMLDRINGMYSIGLYDHRTHELFLIRDRLGVKPLYYCKIGNDIVFASEIKAFYDYPEFVGRVNLSAMSEYIMYRFVAGKETLFREVFCIEAGHYMKISSDDMVDVQYWEIPSNKAESISIELYKSMIEESVRERMLSDVKLGVQLSGGIDSSLVLHYASLYSNLKLETYSIVFEDKKYSEEKWMNMALEQNDAKKNFTTMNLEDVVNLMDKVTWQLDTPITIPNSIGIYLLCSAARKNGVKVLLTGEGADEVFGGYIGDATAIYASTHPFIQMFYESIRKLSGRAANYGVNRKDNYILNDALISEQEAALILGRGIANNGKKRRESIYDSVPGEEYEPRKYLNYKVRTYLIELCMRQDRMAMAASVETRVPFCNYKLLELVRSQNESTYIRGGIRSAMCRNKIPLKKISEQIYGRGFTYRPKSGFPLPIEAYFKDNFFCSNIEKEVLPWIMDTEYIDSDYMRKMWAGKESMKGIFAERLWVIIAFGIWGRKFIGN